MFTMEKIMKRQTCVPNSISSALTIHKNSQSISKLVKPKIRIIHIFAPEIIKTDVENFRELVQRLTGKPTETNTKKKQRIQRKSEPRAVFNKPKALFTNKMQFTERIKGEEEIWFGDQSSGGGYLGGFSDLDGFMKELGGFPFFPLDSSHMDAFGEPQIAYLI